MNKDELKAMGCTPIEDFISELVDSKYENWRVNIERGKNVFVEFYEQYALSNGCPYLRIDTNERNARARAMYKKLGYSGRTQRTGRKVIRQI